MFGGKPGHWIALHGFGTDSSGGSPLLLKRLGSSVAIPFGDVREFAFDQSGARLAWTTQSADGANNSLQLRNLTTGQNEVLDARAPASYQKLSWSKDGQALAALRELKQDKEAEVAERDLIAVTQIDKGTAKKFEFTPGGWAGFPAKHEFDPTGELTWREDGRGLFFKVRALPKPRDPDAPKVVDQLRLWHWEAELVPWQKTYAPPNKGFLSYVSFDNQRYVQLGDADFTAEPHARGPQVLGYDAGGRAGMIYTAISGFSNRDYYLVDVYTSQRTRIADKVQSIFAFGFDPVLSPDGKSVLYYRDGQYFIYDVASTRTRNITEGLPSFHDDRRGRNLPYGLDFELTKLSGWSSDGRYVIVNDHWDEWALPRRIDPAVKPVRLTDNGRAAEIRYEYVNPQNDDPAKRGVMGMMKRQQDAACASIDLSKPMYFRGEHYPSKQSGYIRRTGGLSASASLQKLIWGEKNLADLSKARDADALIYTAQTGVIFPDYHLTDRNFAAPYQITDANAIQRELIWSSGVRRLSYRNDHGEPRYATLWLPANHQPGQKYPTIVNIYEQVADRFNVYRDVTVQGQVNPSAPQTTQQGYAILLPDIVPKADNAGPAALEDMLAGVKAGVATGVVDPDRMALTGQSYGGFQTSFLVTQTNIFKAAVAVDIVSDTATHSLQTYGHVDGPPAIFNNSFYLNNQLYMTQPWWENPDAYARSSAIHYAKNVTTPLLIRQNDRDHATPFFQGVQFFNLLRGMGKPVVMLQYAGADHGSNLERPEDENDFSRRRLEFFDHFLKGAPAPAWWTEGVP
jgi:dipeptidyl aminopeptidase/acylaminoacyl peptidase